LAGVAVPVALVACGVSALLALRHVVRLVAPATAPRFVAPSTDDGSYYWPQPDAMRRAVLRWEQRLAWHADAPETYDQQLRPVLRELADERLRQRHGVTIAADPRQARELLGEPLWGMLTSAHRRGPSMRDVVRAVALFEGLTMSRQGKGQGRG
jgi:hypothetical protein